ncbi:MAG: hypothetical protein AAFP02_04740, partial [Bacteroidota bacterium]
LAPCHRPKRKQIKWAGPSAAREMGRLGPESFREDRGGLDFWFFASKAKNKCLIDSLLSQNLSKINVNLRQKHNQIW